MAKGKGEKRDYTTVSLPWALVDKIDAVVESQKYGYRNRSDFILDSIRKRLRELGALD